MSVEASDADHAERVRKQQAVNMARESLEGQGFDAVVILATYRTETGETAALQAHDGNWYAQNGVMQYILEKRTSVARLEAKDQYDQDRL